MKPTMRTDVYARGQMPPDLQQDYNIWEDRIFEGSNDPVDWAHQDYFMLLWGDDEWTSAVGIIDGTVTVAGLTLPVGGVTTVMTKPHHRCKGYAAYLVQQSVTFITDQLRLPFGFLVCKPPLEAFYASLGWVTAQTSSPPLFRQQNTREVHQLQEYTVPMYYLCADQAWPDGQIYFEGAPW